jgi:hypothetical protein
MVTSGSTGGTAALHGVTVSGTTANVVVSCAGASGTSCAVTLKLTVTEKLRGGKLLAVTAGGKHQGKPKHKTVIVGSATSTVPAGQTHTIAVALNRTGLRLLHLRHKLHVTLTLVGAQHTTVTFKAGKTKHK